MVAPLIGAGIGAIVGMEKARGDANRVKQERRLAALAHSLSPWTKMQAQTQFNDPSMLGAASTGALQGASFGMQDYFKSAPAPTGLQGQTLPDSPNAAPGYTMGPPMGAAQPGAVNTAGQSGWFMGRPPVNPNGVV